MLAQSLKHAFKTLPTLQCTLAMAYPICMISTQECDKTADGVQPRMLAQTRIIKSVLQYVHSLWLARSEITLTVTLLARPAIKNLTEQLMLAQSLKDALEIHPMVRVPVHSLWLA